MQHGQAAIPKSVAHDQKESCRSHFIIALGLSLAASLSLSLLAAVAWTEELNKNLSACCDISKVDYEIK